MSTNLGQLTRAVADARAGNITAFSRLVVLTQDMAYAVALRVIRQKADARDAVQDAYLTAFRRLTELVDDQAFAGWLRRIVISRFVTSLTRKGWRVPSASGGSLLPQK